ncbi:MAG: spermidine/putrescine ABC transporter substrate-binding protein, partial [Actinobacteria bacterium]|nr:spermidine/putrescine ABC transporter substrate-binding protein [Actinomycetota bacterium]
MIKNTVRHLSFFLIVLCIMLSVSLVMTGSAGCKKNVPEELSVYVWEGYLPQAAADIFEKETGIKLNITYATDNAMMLTLLKGGGSADIIMPTQNQVNRFYEEGLAQPLDLEKIPNYEKVIPALKGQPWAKWDGENIGSGQTYVIPYVFGTSGLVVNTEKYTNSLEGIGWEILFDTGLKGRVSAKNAPESLMLTLDVLGISREGLLTDTSATLEKARAKVLDLKANVLKFWDSGAEILDLLNNGEVWVSHIWDGGGRKLMQADSKFIYILPSTGGLGWTDTFMIPSSSGNAEGAHMFIDFMLRPEIAAMLTVDSGYATTVQGAFEAAEGIDKNLYSFTDKELEKLIWQPNFTEETIAIYTDFWEEISTVK